MRGEKTVDVINGEIHRYRTEMAVRMYLSSKSSAIITNKRSNRKHTKREEKEEDR